LSEAVDVAFDNTREFENVHIIQADIFNLPLGNKFDIAYSVGVLHHTPDPARAFQSMQRLVRPGGKVAFWVYGRENNGWIIYFLNPIRKGITRHLPPIMVKAAAWVAATMLWCMMYVFFIPAYRMGIMVYYGEYMRYLKNLGFEEVRCIVYDHLTAPTASYHRQNELEEWFTRAGIENRTLSWVRKISWAGVGVKPFSEGSGGNQVVSFSGVGREGSTGL